MRRLAITALVLAGTLAGLALPATAGAFRAFEIGVGVLKAPTGGIVVGPDGNLWATEPANNSVVRFTQSGQFLQRFDAVGQRPTAMTVGPGGRVWVAMADEPVVVWFDATSLSPTRHPVDISGACTTGATTLAAGGGRLWLGGTGSAGCSGVQTMADDGTSCCTTLGSADRIEGLAFFKGVLFASDSENGNVERWTAGLDNVGLVTTSGAPGPLTFDGLGRAWVVDVASAEVYRFPADGETQDVVTINPVGAPWGAPRGIVTGTDGRLYATGNGTGNLLRIDPLSTTFAFYPIAGGGSPLQIAAGPDGDLFFSDSTIPRVIRFVNGPPRAFTGAATAQAATVAAATAAVDTRGNDTQVVFDYGATTAYGATTGPTSLPAGVGGIPVTAVLGGLNPSTTYHVRVRAINSEGTTTGQDVTVTTPSGIVDADRDGIPAPIDCDDNDPRRFQGNKDKPQDGIDQDCSGRDAPYPELTAFASFRFASGNDYTIVKRLRLIKLQGGERARITCSKRKLGCPFTKRSYKLKKGSRNLDKLVRGRKLRRGVKLTVRITKKETIGSYARLTVKRGDAPVTRRCLRPGKRKPVRC